VFALVGLLTLMSLTLGFIWLLYQPDEQIEKVIWWCCLCFNIIIISQAFDLNQWTHIQPKFWVLIMPNMYVKSCRTSTISEHGGTWPSKWTRATACSRKRMRRKGAWWWNREKRPRSTKTPCCPKTIEKDLFHFRGTDSLYGKGI